jgi:hypothetical protein
MMRARLAAATLLGALALASPGAAALPCTEHEIGSGAAAPHALGTEASTDAIIEAAASVIRDKLGLPFSPTYKAYVCFGEAAFTEGLLRHFGVRGVGSDWRVLPAAAGIATPVGVFFRGDYLARSQPPRRVQLVAHELAHLCQQDLARNRDNRLPAWMAEGHADWVAFQVLDLLGLQTYDVSRAGIVRAVTTSVTPVEHFPDLDTLADHAAWNQSVRSGPATYGQAFLAIEYLIARSSRAALVTFMSSAVEADNPQDRWGEAFPMPYREFTDDFRAHLRSLGRPPSGAPAAREPAPKAGP